MTKTILLATTAILFGAGAASAQTPPPAAAPVAEAALQGVLIFTPDLGVMHEGSVNGAVAGLNRDLELVLHVGEPGLDVVGAVVAIDLAGNRSSSAGYQTTTPTLEEVSGCSTTRGGDTSVVLAWLVVALVVRARVRRAVGA